MGYAHTFKQKRKVSKKNWEAFRKDLVKVFAKHPRHSDSAGGYYQDCDLKIFNGCGKQLIEIGDDLFTPNAEYSLKEMQQDGFGDEAVMFNGDHFNQLDCETFQLTREISTGEMAALFDSCKTGRFPYDWMVCAALILINDHAPKAYDIDSDGGYDDWAPVAQRLANILGRPIGLPEKLVLRAAKSHMKFQPSNKSTHDHSPSTLAASLIDYLATADSEDVFF